MARKPIRIGDIFEPTTTGVKKGRYKIADITHQKSFRHGFDISDATMEAESGYRFHVSMKDIERDFRRRD